MSRDRDESLVDRYSSFALELAQGVVVITLNRPEKRNCLNRAFWYELPQALAWAALQPQARCVLLRAEGPVFTAGIDLDILRQLGQLGQSLESSRRADYLRRTVLSLQHTVSALEQCPLPVVVAVQGQCLGGGLDLISAADIRLAEPRSTFVPMEVDLGFVPDLGTVQRLSKSLAPAVVADWLMTGRAVDGAAALQMGYVSRLAGSADALHELGMSVALQIASKSPVAMRGIKDTARFAQEYGVAASLRYVAAWQSGVFPGRDLSESIRARSDKREPIFEHMANDLPMFGAWDDASEMLLENLENKDSTREK
ncbi:MAG: enoyl-CoA hydratase-related protein [Oceanococcus sp.]